MCIAILNTESRLSDETLKNSWTNNSEGAGLLWTESGRLQTYKTYKLKDLKRKYNQLRDNQLIGKIVLHFRIATSGHERYTNLHPFLVNQNLGFVHNGIITGLGDERYSDTYYFNELLKGLRPDFLSCPSTVELIRSYIGSSKLVFLSSDESHHIVNEEAGTWIGDTWYSNNSHECTLDFEYYGNERRYKQTSFSDFLSYNATTSVESENTEYFQDFWKDSDPLTLSDFLNLTGMKLSDPELWYNMERLSNFYDTNNLRKLLRIMEGERYDSYDQLSY
jgi:hypothetical protein